ncbi:probable F-box protein At4g22030 [Olea europaea var. sylvestris]|uniref:probable F-box protein At4g22030 n=1 Tax=Olea europaea var. sylvestris TaxID=158386 RepID=UPI000C1D19AF|nr:probable F-box protein At4g22030 [Olea europaea var. sylvestris]
MAGIAATSVIGGGAPVPTLKLSSTIIYLLTIGILSIMNKIQPSQLAEEQRNATRLLKQLHSQIQTITAMGNPTTSDNVEPTVWWQEQRRRQAKGLDGKKGWNGMLEEEMREISCAIGNKDEVDYLRLGGKALKLKKFLAIGGPVLTGLVALGSAFVGPPNHGSWVVVRGVVSRCFSKCSKHN